MLPKLMPLGLHPALLATGVVWFAWHPEMVLGAQTGSIKLLYLVDVILFSYVMGWLFLRGGSVWPCVLSHALHNSLNKLVAVTPAHPLLAELTFTTVLAAVVAGLWLLGRDPTRAERAR